jgi:hypothetical protein
MFYMKIYVIHFLQIHVTFPFNDLVVVIFKFSLFRSFHFFSILYGLDQSSSALIDYNMINLTCVGNH